MLKTWVHHTLPDEHAPLKTEQRGIINTKTWVHHTLLDELIFSKITVLIS